MSRSRTAIHVSLVLGVLLITTTWIASHTWVFGVQENLSIRQQNYGLWAMIGRSRFIVGAIKGSAVKENPLVTPLGKDSCHHKWFIDVEPSVFNLVVPVPILYAIPIYFWWRIASSRRRSTQSDE